MSLLDVSGVVSGYGETDILTGVSITVQAGEVVAIIGPNGSGKSTLMKTIFGLLRPRRGEIIFHGESIAGLAPDHITRRGVCYMPQSDNVFPSLSTHENLEMGAFIREDGFSARLEEVYSLFPDLFSKRNARAGSLSGGQRQMLALARALMLDPTLLLLDEPSAGLSPKLVDTIMSKILEINRSGVSILMVEQRAREALKLSTRGYILAMGRNQMEGSGEGLLDNEEVRRLYLGG
ncbi:MAG: ABC transporter ATP-binding protein [Chloroflexi bacterium RBG_13_54_9]|nr:MAG: ABC transporter ATP-binding protein [Chloroflexi bacterium RBG_13_54_9]